MSVHTGMKLYSCDVCEKRFTRATSLERHKTIHTGDRLHTCGICGKDYARADVLVNHMLNHARKMVHTPQRGRHCDVCGKFCGNPGGFQMHRKTHTKEKGVKCVIKEEVIKEEEND